jgi:hypothetical protein
VFIIRDSFEEAFREKFAAMLAACPKYDLVHQEMDPIFPGITAIPREKPWGTLHATLSAAHVVDQPFAVINADDRYGTQSYAKIYKQLLTLPPEEALLV